MTAFQVQRIDHVVLRVSDLDRSTTFYRGLWGCEVAKRREDLGLVHLRAGASMIDLVWVDGPLGRPGGTAAGTGGRNQGAGRARPTRRVPSCGPHAAPLPTGSPRYLAPHGGEATGREVIDFFVKENFFERVSGNHGHSH